MNVLIDLFLPALADRIDFSGGGNMFVQYSQQAMNRDFGDQTFFAAWKSMAAASAKAGLLGRSRAKF